MNLKAVRVILVTLLVVCLHVKGQKGDEKKSYANHRIVRAFPESSADQLVLYERESCRFLQNPWNMVQPVDFLCTSSKEADALMSDLGRGGVTSRKLTEDLDSQNEDLLKAKTSDRAITTFMRYTEVITYLRSLSNNAKLSKFLKIDFGTKLSTEGRWLPVLKIGNSANGTKTRAVYIDAGIYGREWLSIATALYIIDQLITMFTNPTKFPNDPRLQVDWYIFPLMNPDGYEYTFTTDRLWKKNRALPPKGSNCRGVDLNRNFEIGWGIASSKEPCGDLYQGETPNSEMEVQRAIEYLTKLSNFTRVSVSLQSFGQFVMTPWNYKTEIPPDNAKTLDLAKKIAASLKFVNGRCYIVGTGTQVWNPRGGSVPDFAKGKAGIPNAFTIVLPGNSYIFPTSLIPSVGDEMMEALTTIATFVLDEQF